MATFLQEQQPTNLPTIIPTDLIPIRQNKKAGKFLGSYCSAPLMRTGVSFLLLPAFGDLAT